MRENFIHLNMINVRTLIYIFISLYLCIFSSLYKHP